MKKPCYYYITNLNNGFIGSILYLCPIFIPYMLVKEIYRIEIKVRNLDSEDDINYYYSLH